MFKITCFLGTSPEKLSIALSGLRFQQTKDGFIWGLDGHIFHIKPFKNQARGTLYGYRIYFNGSIDGGLYLFDTSLGCLSPKVTGVEYSLFCPTKSKLEWIQDFNSRRTFSKTDTIGIYRKGNAGIVVLEDSVSIQIRSFSKRPLKLIECLKQLDILLSEIKPLEYDLFSFSQEGVAK
ncbi:hypothetical protein [Sutcliffiella cohnii]|uniref:hypothetical protein n=1 Tax=Sutcliffiella cohnii TaxID=33932 RepID=UPI000832EE06|nr:hypothetical protein [Sutcliffiella cohnii]